MSFRIVLWFIGLALAVASRFSARVRSQLARDMTIVVASADGVARSYVMQDRRVSSRAGANENARATLRFRSAGLGTRILLAPDTIGRIVDGLETGDVECIGQASIIMWFYQLVMGLNPLSPNPRDVWPNCYTAHDPNLKAADRITVEPPVDDLEGERSAAHAQRDKVLLWQVGLGGPVTGNFPRHKIVVPLEPEASELSQ